MWCQWAQRVASQNVLPFLTPPPDWPDTQTENCDLNVIGDKINLLNSLCTTSECSVDCAIRLLPLLADCRDILDAMYDAIDGRADGDAAIFDTASDMCLQIPSHDALHRVEQLHSNGVCPDEILDGVAEVEVVDGAGGECLDTNDNCPIFLSMGVACDTLVGTCDLTCEVCQPCEDINPNCGQFIAMGVTCENLVGTCGLTCGVCGHRRRTLDVHRGRRVQETPSCDLANLQANTAKINEACCDTRPGDVCADGVPTTCDAKCAIFFVTLYDQCRDYLALQLDPATASAMDSLASTCADELPTEDLLLAAAECTHSRIFALGGYGTVDTPSSVQGFDLVTGNWTLFPPMSGHRGYFGAAFVDDMLYAVGGRDSAYATLSSVEALDFRTGLWSDIAPLQTARCGHAVVAAAGLIYAIGGNLDGVYLDSVETYDPTVGRWTNAAPLQVSRFYVAAAVYDRHIYVLGGITAVGDGAASLSSVEVLDLTTGLWGAVGPMNIPRYGHAAAAANGHLYVVGGYTGTAYLTSVEALDLEEYTGTWVGLTPMVTARNYLAVAVASGKLYAMGGFGATGFQESVEVLELDTAPQYVAVANHVACCLALY